MALIFLKFNCTPATQENANTKFRINIRIKFKFDQMYRFYLLSVWLNRDTKRVVLSFCGAGWVAGVVVCASAGS